MTISVKEFLKKPEKDSNFSGLDIDNLFNQYLELKEKWLTRELEKAVIISISKIYIDIERNGIGEPDRFPSIEDLALLSHVIVKIRQEEKMPEVIPRQLGDIFPDIIPKEKTCTHCKWHNAIDAKVCEQCGNSFQ